ncbi:flagellar biosynthesis repressor FlbT [Methylobacterium thuringiense]|nr:flagellar biosynthesis repressor FlbT [Methylobacterium thuringiense]
MGRFFLADHDADTVCKTIYVLLQRMYRDGNHQAHEDAFLQLANKLMSVTRTYGTFFLALDDRIQERDYAGALLVGQALLQHEAMLHDIAAGKPIRRSATLN